MLNTVFLMLVLIFQPSELDTGYFYFGNTNLIGMGLLKEGFKSGEWKIYSKTNPDDFPKNSILEADPADFKRDFNQEIPLFIMNFEEGVPNGDFLENYPNGKPKVMAHQKDGVFDGEFGEFYKSGELRLNGKVLDGKKEGEWKEFLPTGDLITSISFKEGLPEGKAVGYYPSGLLQWESNFKKGELDGPYTYFFEDSTLLKKGQYAEGIPIGEWQERLEILPSFIRKGSYQDGLKEGEWQLTNLEGDFLQAEFYEKGKLISTGEFQLPEQFVDRGKIKNGNGQRYFYDEEGNILAKGKISKGMIDGLWYFYFPESDRVSASGRLDGSDRVGRWNFYSYQGEILDQTVYYQKPDNSKNSRTSYTRKNDPQVFGVVQGSEGTGLFGQGWDLNTFQQNNTMGQFLK